MTNIVRTIKRIICHRYSLSCIRVNGWIHQTSMVKRNHIPSMFQYMNKPLKLKKKHELIIRSSSLTVKYWITVEPIEVERNNMTNTMNQGL